MDLKNLGSFVQIESLATRDVAQSGSASVLGTGGRRFESCHPEQNCLNLYIHKKIVSPFFMVNGGRRANGGIGRHTSFRSWRYSHAGSSPA